MQVDPGFLALPGRRLAEAALGAVAELGVEHGDFRFERVRYQRIQARDGHLQGSGTPRTSGSRSGSSTAARGGSRPACS